MGFFVPSTDESGNKTGEKLVKNQHGFKECELDDEDEEFHMSEASEEGTADEYDSFDEYSEPAQASCTTAKTTIIRKKKELQA